MSFLNAVTAVCAVATVICSNCVPLVEKMGYGYIWIFVLLFLAINLLPFAAYRGPKSFSLRMCSHGVVCLKTFCIALPFSAAVQIYYLYAVRETGMWWGIASVSVAAAVLAVIFWSGIIVVYVFSTQLGISHRLRGIMLGFVPGANLIMLAKIIKTVSSEIEFESEKLTTDSMRSGAGLCCTKYPILFVHGVCFRDFSFPNYWGRVPHELEKNGSKVFFGNHGSAASVKDSALELSARIRYITDDLGYEKVNIIAHSKGGLDCRYAIAKNGIGNRVASLITINTPHRGCAYADYLLDKIPEKIQSKVASTYNKVLKRLGDDSPDFLAAMRDLTESRVCEMTAEFNDENGIDGIYCVSVGSMINRHSHTDLPMSLTHGFVKKHEGENDGLVAVDSFEWSGEYRFIENNSPGGISHVDIIDMTKKNIPGFDVREFYVKIAEELKQKGL